MLSALGHESETRHIITRRLATMFVVFSHDTVERCVADVWACAEHLGFEATTPLIERMAYERLTAMVKSEPPSGRFR
jgi:hypothetical protein